MSYSAALELVGDVSAAAGVPHRIERANVTLNHGLLVGELLGVPIEGAQRVLDTVSDREDSTLTVGEMQALRATYGAVRAKLDLAVGPDGLAAANPAGEVLRASDLLEADAAGVLAVRHRRMPLTELRARLDEIDRMVSHALAHGAAVRLEPT